MGAMTPVFYHRVLPKGKEQSDGVLFSAEKGKGGAESLPRLRFYLSLVLEDEFGVALIVASNKAADIDATGNRSVGVVLSIPDE